MPAGKRWLILAAVFIITALAPLAMMEAMPADQSSAAIYIDQLKVVVFLALCTTLAIMRSLPRHD